MMLTLRKTLMQQHSLFGTDIEITDEQMQQMVSMYRHNEDCNVAINDTLEDTVKRALKR